MKPEERAEYILAAVAGAAPCSPAAASLIAAQIREAEAAARERCILAVCEHCLVGNKAFLVEDVWVHSFTRHGKEYRGRCYAAAIRELP